MHVSNSSTYSIIYAGIMVCSRTSLMRTPWTTTASPEYRAVCISEASGILSVGVAVDTVEHEATFQSSVLLYTGEEG